MGWGDRVAAAVESSVSVVASSFSFVALLATALLVSPVAASLILVIGGLLTLTVRPMTRRARRAAQLYAARAYEYAGSIGECAAVTDDVVAFGVVERYLHGTARQSGDVADLFKRARLWTMSAPQTYVSFGYLAIFGALGMGLSTNRGAVSSWGAVLLLVMRSLSAGQGILTYRAQLHAHAPFVENALVATQISPTRDVRTADWQRAPVLSCEDVHHRYGDGPFVLRSVSLEIYAGEVVAVVGPSGAGKSTLAQILAGRLVPEHGRVRLFGADPELLSPGDRAKALASVTQSPTMVRGTIVENVSFFREIEQRDVATALESVALLDEVQDADGIHGAELDPSTGGLSGGQKQRLALARALVGRPRVVVLDEPTSALDGRTEAVVLDAIEALRTTGAVVMLTHHPRAISIADRVVVVEAGRVTCVGTPAQVATESAFFRSMMAHAAS